MADRYDPGFSNQFAEEAGFPSSGAMQQGAGRGGLPPQRQQMPFEHKQSAPISQAVPYVQPIMQGTPAAQGSQFQVRPQQISPGVASFLRANAIDQGAKGVEQRLGQIESQMQGISQPRDAAVQSMANMRASRDQREGIAAREQMMRGRAPAGRQVQPGAAPVGAMLPDAAMMSSLFPQGFAPTPIGDRMAFQRGGAPAPAGISRMAEGIAAGAQGGQQDWRQAADTDRGVPATAVWHWDRPADVDRGVTVAQAPAEIGGMARGLATGAQGAPAPAEISRMAGGIEAGARWDPAARHWDRPADIDQRVSADWKEAADVDQRVPDTPADWKEAADIDQGIPGTPSKIGYDDQMQAISDKLGQLGDKVSKGIIEDAKQQVQKQKDYLHAALSEAGGGILAGGAPLLAQESINATKAIVAAQHNAAKAEAAIASAQAGIMATLLSQENKVELADKALQWAKDRYESDADFREKSYQEQMDWAKEKFGKTMDWNTRVGKRNALIASMEVLMKGGYEADPETIIALAKAIASGKELTDEDYKKYFKPKDPEPALVDEETGELTEEGQNRLDEQVDRGFKELKKKTPIPNKLVDLGQALIAPQTLI